MTPARHSLPPHLPQAAQSPFPLIGNRLCVDFANTVPPGRAISSWADLVAFLEATGIVGAAQRRLLLELATTAPETTAAVVRKALRLRSALRKILEAVASGLSIFPERIAPVNALLRLTEGYDQLMPAAGGWRLGFVEREQRVEWLLAAIARSAAQLIAEGPGAPVRKCGNPACVLYFYDTSRTGRRRWCSMAVCGNRNKVAAHARRLATKRRRRARATTS